MNLFRSIGLAGWALRSALTLARRASAWLPFWIVAASQLLILGLLLSFHRPLALPIVLPILNRFGGDAASHYPQFYFYLPQVYSRLTMLLSIFVASLAVGAATLVFAEGYGIIRPGSLWVRLRRGAPWLILLTGISAAMMYGVSALSGLVPRDVLLHDRYVRWGVRGGSLLAIILVETFLAYGTAWVVLRGAHVLTAVRDSARVTLRTFLPTLIVVGVPLFLLYPASYLTGRIDLFATKLAPESLVVVLLGRIVLELVFGFLLVGAVTRLFVLRMEAAH